MSQVINWKEKEQAMLKARQERISNQKPVRLPQFSKDLGEDVFVQVRQFEVGEEAAYFGAPESLSEMIAKRTAGYLKLMASASIEMNDDGSVNEQQVAVSNVALSQDPAFRAMVNTVCLASAVSPRIVESEAERSGVENALLLSSLTYGDRLQIFYGAQSGTKEEGGEGKSLGEFREETTPDVEDPAPKQDAKAAKRSTRAKGSRVVSEGAA